MSDMHVESDAVPDVVPDVTPETPVGEAHHHAEDSGLSERVDRIEASVSELSDKVTGLLTPDLPGGDDEEEEERDETPVSVPWTHRGFGGH